MKYLSFPLYIFLALCVLAVLANMPDEPRVDPVQSFKQRCAAEGGRYVYTDTDGHLCLK